MNRTVLIIIGVVVAVILLAVCAAVVVGAVAFFQLAEPAAPAEVEVVDEVALPQAPIHNDCSLLGTDPLAPVEEDDEAAEEDEGTGNGNDGEGAGNPQNDENDENDENGENDENDENGDNDENGVPEEEAEDDEPNDFVERFRLEDLRLEFCRWDAGGVLMPVPEGWTAEIMGPISANAGDLGAIRIHGRGVLEPVTITMWARDDARPADPSVFYPNPWIALDTVYETEVRGIRETSIAGHRAAEARGLSGRRPVIVQAFYDGDRAWVFGGSSDEATRDYIVPLLDMLASSVHPLQ